MADLFTNLIGVDLGLGFMWWYAFTGILNAVWMLTGTSSEIWINGQHYHIIKAT